MMLKNDLYNPQVLLVNGQLEQSNELVQGLRENGMEVNIAGSAQQALDRLQQRYCDVLLLEVPAPDMPSAQMVAVARNRFPFLPIVVLADKNASIST